MNTHIVGKNEKGQDINSDGELVLDCKTGCGRKTTMDGTGLCDFCWEEERKRDRQAREAAGGRSVKAW